MTYDFLAVRRRDDPVRWEIGRFLREASTRVPAGARVLDAGAGEGAYRPLFPQARYVTVDLGVGDATWNYRGLDVVSLLERLPFPDGTFDHAVCTQAIEHVRTPRRILEELRRVVKPAGHLWITAPFGFGHHQEPHDYFRFTRHGLRMLLEEAGFEIVALRPAGGRFVRLAYEIGDVRTFLLGPRFTRSRPAWPLRKARSCLLRALGGCLTLAQWTMVWLDRLDPEADNTMNFLCEAVRRET